MEYSKNDEGFIPWKSTMKREFEIKREDLKLHLNTQTGF